MPKLWKKTGNAKDNSDLVEVALPKLTISGPTVVFFPGQVASDSNSTEISKNLNSVKELFCDQPEPPQVYLWSQPDRSSGTRDLSSAFQLALYSFSLQRHSPSAAENLAKSLVIPLVSNAEGRPLPYEEAQKNLRNLAFFGYCIGSVAAQEVYNASMKLMRKTGYSKEESRKLLHEIVLVTIGTFSSPEKERNRYATIALAYNDDRIVGRKELVMHPLHRIFSNSSQRLEIKPLSDTSLFVSADARMRQPHKETPKEVIADVQLPPWSKKAFNHAFKDYVNTDDKSCQFSRIVQNALINAISRKTTPKPLDLLQAPATLGMEEKSIYQSRIAQALSL